MGLMDRLRSRRGEGAAGQRRSRRRRLILAAQALALALLAGFLALRVWDPVPVQMVRHAIFDQFQALLPRAEGSGQVVIVDIDEESLARHGQWPWPRTLLAELVERLFALGADVAAFDIVFAEPDRLSPPQLAGELPGLSEDARALLAAQPDNDARFAATLARSRVVLGQAALHTAPVALERVETGAGTVAELGPDPRPFLQRYANLVRNLPVLEEAAGGVGTVTIALEQDGVARRVPLALVVGERILPALTIEALRLRAGEPTVLVRSGSQGVNSIVAGGHAVPTDRQARIWVRFGRPGSIPYVSAADVLAGAVQPDAIAGRIVLVGTTAAGLFDIKRTPMSPATPGVEVHAHLLETVLTGTHLRRPASIEGAEVAAILAASLLVIVLTPMVGALLTLVVGAALMAALALATWYLYTQHLMLMDVSFAALSSFALYGLITYVKYVTEEGERKAVREAFAHYLPPALVERLAAHPEQLRLGGEARVLTILFSDVRGFTTIAESLSAEELAALVNRVLTAMTGAVLEHGGTVDKYIGDCVMALWNAPLDDPEHPRRACRAALALVRAVEELSRELAAGPGEFGEGRIAVGVGLNTGRASVGNFGSAYRFDYTALGDSVNLASRLEGLSRTYGCPVVVGESTIDAVPDFAALELDVVQVKGRQQAVRVFALLGDETVAADPAFQRLHEAHGRLLEAYGQGDGARAMRALAGARAAADGFELGRLYDLYQQRIAAESALPDTALGGRAVSA